MKSMNPPLMIVGIILILLGTVLGSIGKYVSMHNEAIESGCAQYNPQTGAFEWLRK